MRPYKEAWSVDRAMALLRDGAGRNFEPRLIELFDAIQAEILDIKSRWGAKEID